jgi:hypothetical protein
MDTQKPEYIGVIEFTQDDEETSFVEVFSDGENLFTGITAENTVIVTEDDFSVRIADYYSEQTAMEDLENIVKNFFN